MIVGHHVELIGGGELEVAPGVSEQLRELCLLGRQLDDRVGQPTKKRGGMLTGGRGACPDDLWQLEQLRHRPTFCNALGTESDVKRKPEVAESALDVRRDARIDR